MLALLFQLASQTAPLLVTDVQSRIPKTPLVVSLDLSEWKGDDSKATPLSKSLGDKLLLAGTMAPSGSILTVIVETNDPPVSPQTWRERLAPPGQPFDVQFTPCVDASSQLAPGMSQSDYHAYFATRTHVLDIHVSRLSDKDKEPLPRAEFERIVKSVRVLALRNGWTEDYPREIAIPMTMASILGVERDAWVKGYFPKHAEEWTAHFANAEFLRFGKAAPDIQIGSYEKALALIDKVVKPDAQVRFATAMICDGMSLAQYDAKRFAASIAPLQKSLALLEELKRPERGNVAYNLACAQALTQHKPQALEALKRAIELNPQIRESAAKDADFSSIKDDPAFRALIANPAEAPPVRKNGSAR